MAITIPILTEFSDKGIRAAEGAFSKLGNIAKKATIALSGVAVAGGAGVLKAIDVASDLAESQAKIGEIFGAGSSEVERFAESAAAALGQSKQSVLDAAGTFGTFGKAAGLGGKDLARFSNDFTALASDLASFNNTSPEDAIQAIGAALRGEAEPMRRYGVLLDDATLKQEALALGIIDTTKKALTPQQKILAAQAAIYKQTADAQGDFERTSGGLANQQRILKAQLQNAATTIGTVLLPMATKMFSVFAEKVIPVVEKVTEVFQKEGFSGVAKLIQKQIPKVLNVLKDLGKKLIGWVGAQLPIWLDKLQELGQALIDWIGPRIGPMLSKLGEWIAAAANWILNTGLPLLVDKLIELGNALVDWIKPNIVPMLKKLGELLGSILEWIVTEAIPKLTKEALKLAGALLSWVADLLPKAIAGLATFALELIKKIPGLFVDVVTAFADKGLEIGGKILDGIVSFVLDLPGKIMSVASEIWDRMVEFGKKLVDKIVEGILAAPGKIKDALRQLLPGGGGFFSGGTGGLFSIRAFADGGIVTGPTLGLVGEAGPEAIIPLDQLSGLGGGITVNVAGSVITENDLVETVRRGLVNAQRSGSPLVYVNAA